MLRCLLTFAGLTAWTGCMPDCIGFKAPEWVCNNTKAFTIGRLGQQPAPLEAKGPVGLDTPDFHLKAPRPTPAWIPSSVVVRLTTHPEQLPRTVQLPSPGVEVTVTMMTGQPPVVLSGGRITIRQWDAQNFAAAFALELAPADGPPLSIQGDAVVSACRLEEACVD
jgi:hypothetical protein